MEHALQTTNLADILERVLDKGIVIAGDITISLVEIDLLNIKLRLLIASVDKAKELGINWWETDPKLSSAQTNSSGKTAPSSSASIAWRRSFRPSNCRRPKTANAARGTEWCGMRCRNAPGAGGRCRRAKFGRMAVGKR